MSANNITPFELARVLRLSEQELVGLTKQGVLHRTTEKRKGRERIVYPWRECVGNYIEHILSADQQSRKDYQSEKAMTQKIIRTQKELELAKLRGELIERKRVVLIMTNLLTALKNHIRAIPARVSRLVLGLTSFGQIHDVLQSDVDRALREVNNFDMDELATGIRTSGTNGQHDRARRKAKKTRRASK
jgi:hypothetical protein